MRKIRNGAVGTGKAPKTRFLAAAEAPTSMLLWQCKGLRSLSPNVSDLSSTCEQETTLLGRIVEIILVKNSP